MPWGKTSDERLDIDAAREILEADHAGMKDVKARILEYLAVRKFRREREIEDEQQGVILALVGPPGVGKTSLGESIARALDRKFVRMSLGGVRDEAEIRGHRRTYVGALPGRLVRALRDAGTMNPVILLDEIDKLGSDWRGDPSSALLEVLDPAQNSTFRDHYLDVQMDLSQVLFIATANIADPIPRPLYDRLEVISLDGYTEEEKVAIATGYLIPRQIPATACCPSEVMTRDDAVRRMIGDYTREAGVRSLERASAPCCARPPRSSPAARPTAPIRSAPTTCGSCSAARFFNEAAERTSVPGVATGLAVTGAGGDMLFVEATAMPGNRGLTLTGQLGDVMQESATIALSYVRTKGLAHDIDPRGSTSASSTSTSRPAPSQGRPERRRHNDVALVSLLTGRPVPRRRHDRRGDLQGRVLPVGGIKQKVLAAHRAGLKNVILPARNAATSTTCREGAPAAPFHPVHTVEEALAVALEPVRRACRRWPRSRITRMADAHRFEAELRASGRGGGTLLDVPQNISEALAQRGRVPVRVSVNGVAFRGSMRADRRRSARARHDEGSARRGGRHPG